MSFELGRIAVHSVELGGAAGLRERTLVVDAEALAAELEAAFDGIRRVAVHVARPGEATRIACVKDVVEPRVKLDGSGRAWAACTRSAASRWRPAGASSASRRGSST